MQLMAHRSCLLHVSVCVLVAGDTDGIVGPQTTWREVQWTKIRMLSKELGLRPWYCTLHPSFCETVEWQ